MAGNASLRRTLGAPLVVLSQACYGTAFSASQSITDLFMKKLWLLTLGGAAFAQDALSLRDAVLLGLRENKAIAAATAANHAAEKRILQARGGSL